LAAPLPYSHTWRDNQKVERLNYKWSVCVSLAFRRIMLMHLSPNNPIKKELFWEKCGIILLIQRSSPAHKGHDPIMSLKLWHIEASLHSPSPYFRCNPASNEKWLNLQYPTPCPYTIPTYILYHPCRHLRDGTLITFNVVAATLNKK